MAKQYYIPGTGVYNDAESGKQYYVVSNGAGTSQGTLFAEAAGAPAPAPAEHTLIDAGLIDHNLINTGLIK